MAGDFGRDFDEPLFVAFAEDPQRFVALLLAQRSDRCAQHVHAPQPRADHQRQQRPVPQAEQGGRINFIQKLPRLVTGQPQRLAFI